MLVRLVVQPVERGAVRLAIAAEADRRAQGDHGHRHPARGIARHHADGVVAVVVDHEARAGGQVQEPQHVAARQRGDEGLFGVDAGRVRIRQRHDVRRRGAGHDGAAIETPLVPPAVVVVGEAGPLALPMHADGVLGHGRLRG